MYNVGPLDTHLPGDARSVKTYLEILHLEGIISSPWSSDNMVVLLQEWNDDICKKCFLDVIQKESIMYLANA